MNPKYTDKRLRDLASVVHLSKYRTELKYNFHMRKLWKLIKG